MATQLILFEEALEIFILDCEAARLTRRSVDFYRRSAETFIRWAHAQELQRVDQVTTHHVRSYLQFLRDAGHSSNYQSNLAVVLKRWLKFCVNEKFIPENPYSANVRTPRPEKKDLAALSEDEVRRVLRACPTRRDRAIVRLFLSTGVRAAELCQLRVGDVDWRTGLVRVKQGKGQKDRSVFCDLQTRKALRLYLTERGPMVEAEPLFVTLKRYQPFTTNTVVQLMIRLQRLSKVEHCTAHALRRTFALNCLRSGMNIHVLARLMGHSDIQVLERYLPLVEADLEEEYRKHGPKSV